MLLFDFYGYLVQLQSENLEASFVFENLVADFEHFLTQPGPTPHLQIRLHSEKSKEQIHSFQKGPLLFRTRMCRAYGWKQRFCDYGKGHGVFHEDESRCLVFGTDSFLIYEIVYILLLSKIGEELEHRRGWLKLHALGWVANKEAVLALLPSGGGKSHLAKRILDERKELLLGDEILFCDGKTVYPFPIRLALRESSAMQLSVTSARIFKRKVFDAKYLLPIPKDRIASPAPLRQISLGYRSVRNSIQEPTLKDRLYFLFLCVSGWGLPQMREHLIRKQTFFRIPFWTIQRIKTGINLLRRSEIQVLQISHQSSDPLKLLYQRLDPKSKAWSTRRDEVAISP